MYPYFTRPAGLAYADNDPGMEYYFQKSDSERYGHAWHAAHCRIGNCKLCDDLCDEGVIISCDNCSRVHHTDWLGWHGELKDDGRCSVYCPECKETKEMNWIEYDE